MPASDDAGFPLKEFIMTAHTLRVGAGASDPSETLRVALLGAQYFSASALEVEDLRPVRLRYPHVKGRAPHQSRRSRFVRDARYLCPDNALRPACGSGDDHGVEEDRYGRNLRHLVNAIHELMERVRRCG